MKKVLAGMIAVLFAAVFSYSGCQLWEVYHGYSEESNQHEQLMVYKPIVPLAVNVSSAESVEPAPAVNQNIIDLQAKYPDVAGWLTIPNTGVDYPFVQAADNDYYLRRDLDGQYLNAGTIFMDYRDQRDFSGFNTVIYGHNMNNGSMFGTLKDFNDQQFFDADPAGTLFLADRTYTIEFFAVIVLAPTDPVIYDPTIGGVADEKAFLDHVKDTARYYRDIDVTPDDHIITLSTCNYEFNNARMVLLGKLVEI